jgi:hypothetical protein
MGGRRQVRELGASIRSFTPPLSQQPPAECLASADVLFQEQGATEHWRHSDEPSTDSAPTLRLPAAASGERPAAVSAVARHPRSCSHRL